MKRAHKRNLRGGLGGAGAMVEALEERQLFAADFGVSWNIGAFHLPAVLVPGDRFNPAGGANRLEVPIRIENTGTEPGAGNVRVDFYLSADAALDPAQDTLIKSFGSQLWALQPGGSVAFSPDMQLPANLAPGTYHLIAKIVPSGTIGDTNTGNNVAVSGGTVDVVRKFGDFDGRTNVALTLRDADGTLVTFTQTGGGFGEVTTSPSGFGVVLTGATDATRVRTTASGGDDRFRFTSVAINGSVKEFFAPKGHLAGPLSATTGFGAMTFGDVVGAQTISVPSSSRTPSFTFGNVSELSLTSAVGIDSITVGSWIDRDGTPDAIRAPWIKTLTSSGNFYPSIFLSGGFYPSNADTYTLGTVNIGGVIKAGAWAVVGTGGTVNAYATTAIWSATFRDGFRQLNITNSMRGVLTGRYLQELNIGKDLLAGKTLAGAYLGEDGRFGGSGLDADQYTDGTIGSLIVGRNVAGNFVGAGVDPVDGVFGNGNDAIIGGSDRSAINRIWVGHIAGRQSRFIANTYPPSITWIGQTTPQPPNFRFGGVAVDPATDSRFALRTLGPVGHLMSSSLADVGGSMIATIQLDIDSRALIDMDSIIDGSIVVTGPNGFSAPAFVQSKYWNGNNQYDQADSISTFTVRLNYVGQPVASGTYTISFAPNGISDTRGNAATSMTVGTFSVA